MSLSLLEHSREIASELPRIRSDWEPQEIDLLALESKTLINIPFGYDGCGANITPFGEIIQLTKYIPDKECYTENCYYIAETLTTLRAEWTTKRQKKIEQCCQTPLTGLGLRLKNKIAPQSPRLEWVHDRWPRITYKDGNTQVQIKFLVSQGTVYQQYTIYNEDDKSFDVNFDLNCGVRILGDPVYYADMTEEVHLFLESSGNSASLMTESVPKKIESTEAIRVLITVYKDGEPFELSALEDQLKDGTTLTIINLPDIKVAPTKKIKFTVTYSIQALEPNEVQTKPPYIDINAVLQNEPVGIWHRASESSPIDANDQDKTTLIYRRTLEYILSTCQIPVYSDPANSSDYTVAMIDGEMFLPSIETVGTL
jgi:hypothetical protein